MSELKVNKLSPESGTAFTLGDSGDTFTVPAGANIVNSGTATGFGGGAWNFISSATASSSSSVDFTSGIDSTYDMYMFVLSDVSVTTGNRLWLRTGAGSFDSGGSDYAFHQTLVKENSTSYAAYASESNSFIAVGSSDGGTGVKHLVGTVKFYNPAGTTFRKLFSMDTVQTGSSNAAYCNTGMGMRDSTAAITRVQFVPMGGTILNGSFSLYGLAKS